MQFQLDFYRAPLCFLHVFFKRGPNSVSQNDNVNTYAQTSASEICLQNICGQQQNFPMAGAIFAANSGPPLSKLGLATR
jgi:hypothetical protein